MTDVLTTLLEIQRDIRATSVRIDTLAQRISVLDQRLSVLDQSGVVDAVYEAHIERGEDRRQASRRVQLGRRTSVGIGDRHGYEERRKVRRREHGGFSSRRFGERRGR